MANIVNSQSKPAKSIAIRARAASNTIQSQKSKHGFYEEFSVIPTANDSFRLKKGTKSTWGKITSSFKPAPDQTFCEKCTENMHKLFNRNCIFGLFPIFQWLPHYKFNYFKKDAMSGITVSILLVPQSLAYATLAGLPPEWGLYASVMPILFYTIWSTSCAVAVGPVAPTAIMVASAVDGIISKYNISENEIGYDELYQSIAMTLSFVCGIILIIFGLIRAGFIIVFLSRPVMTGFIMSAAFIILINQLRSLMGLDMSRYPLFYETLIAFFEALHTINWYTTLISFISLFILFVPKCCLKGKIPKWVPIPLIVIVMWILISYFADLESLGVSIIGNEIKSGFPTPKSPNFDYIGDVFASAIVVAIVSYMGSIALAKGFDQKRRETFKQERNKYNTYCHTFNNNKNKSTSPNSKSENNNNNNNKPPKQPLSLPPINLNPNMEFIAFGISNLFGSFFSSQVISASFSRSALNFDMNGWTQISSHIQAMICLLCLLLAMPLLSPLPNCVLASLVTVSVYRLIKNGIYEFIFLLNVSQIELIEFLIAFIAPLIIGLEIGIFLAIATSVIVNLLRHSFTSIIFLGRLQSTMSDECEYVDCKLFKEAKCVPHITIIEMKAELSFSNNNRLVDKLRRLLAGGNKYIVVSLNLTSFIDTTAIRQIVTIFEDAKGSFICLSQCRPKVFELIKRYEKDIGNRFPDNVKTFISTHDAVLYLSSIRSKQLHHCGFDFDDDDASDNSLTSLPMYNITGGTVTPQLNSIPITTRDREISDYSIRRHTFSFRVAGRNKSDNSELMEQVGTDSDGDTDHHNNIINSIGKKIVIKPWTDPMDSVSISDENNNNNNEVKIKIINIDKIDKIDEGKEVPFDDKENNCHNDNKKKQSNS